MISQESTTKDVKLVGNSHIGGFYTRDFVKPTALDRTFLNGKSFHPTHIFKSIVFSEAVRLRRLNKTQFDYLASLERLKQKCIHSQFNIKSGESSSQFRWFIITKIELQYNF